MVRYMLCFMFCVVALCKLNAQNPLVTEDAYAQKKWIDSVYNALTLSQKIGQIFMVAAHSDISHPDTQKAFELIQKYDVGGVCFFKGNPKNQVITTNKMQGISKVPLMVAIDGEWGLSMRLDSTFAYPWNMTLGAIKNNNSLVENTGYQIGLHCKRMGIHINFAPDTDVNYNYKNPIIGNRSFGESPENVALKGIAFSKGIQQADVLACAKHFPGHGDTSKDSHKELPVIPHDIKRLTEVEMYPFKKAIEGGISTVMVGHLDMPALEPKGLPSSLSKAVITDKLRNEMQFEGIICTDALNMKGVADFKGVKNAGYTSFLAGSDLILMCENVPQAISMIQRAYKRDVNVKKRLEASVKRILMAKYKVGLSRYKDIDTTNLIQDINTNDDKVLYETLAENSITVLKNENNLLPIKNLDVEKLAYIGFGEDSGDTFYKTLNYYNQVDCLSLNQSQKVLLEKLKPYTRIIIGLHRSNQSPWKPYEFSKDELQILNAISEDKDVILDIFVKPYALINVPLEHIKSVVVSYQNSDVLQSKSAQIIFGGIGASARLPVQISEQYPVGSGIDIKPIQRLRYGTPESVGLNSKKLEKIDEVMQSVIDKNIAPGGQVLVSRYGKVIFHKAYGYYTYEKHIPVTLNTIYDLASLTKILASLPEVMVLQEQGALNLSGTLKEALPHNRLGRKGKLKLIEMFSHYARLQAWSPFYKETLMEDGTPLNKYYRVKPENDFSLRVAKSMYLRKNYPEKVFKEIVKMDLLDKKEYKYSDLPYYFTKKIIENHYKESLDKLVQKHFYKLMGMPYTMYNPLDKFTKDMIAPSEEDNYYRYQRLQGYVHDMGAAMLGGVGGHAGLFSNANDVAKMMQMYLQGGFYGGTQYFEQKTFDLFNTCYFCLENVRRGLILDKPQKEGDSGPAYEKISKMSFGHTGFTGTMAWADPETGILFVFMSNRTYPKMSNSKLVKLNIRTHIHQLIYEAIEE